ncbi:TIGR00725 family protein [Pseudothermotoga thermarum]|uniref:TIGR00725 family protein n=1 Tax=Pseudothermotoga thermarum DSM 5069 TaxID=688269 RepID=F7YU93_9THEM|nr:TIGR00725 family protein [Pseudothermotoga thermarum]AEH50192.1 Conserved hypothetical protein CHP00730 [Pseudothermotoga thermarum DSM 5069]
MNVAVVGYSGDIDKSPVKELAEKVLELGRRLAKEGHVILNGGRDGVMELVSKAVKEAGGTVIGVLPAFEYGNDYLTFRVKTPFDNVTRSIVLIESSDVVVSVGGEVGTAIEILLAYAKFKPVILFVGTGGWTDRFASVLIEGKYLDNRKNVEVRIARDVQEVIDIINEIGRMKNE